MRGTRPGRLGAVAVSLTVLAVVAWAYWLSGTSTRVSDYAAAALPELPPTLIVSSDPPRDEDPDAPTVPTKTQTRPFLPSITDRVARSWVDAVAEATGIPPRALLAYAGATLRLAEEQPSCGLGWTTVAAIGAVESDHGRHGGSLLSAEGIATPPIYGPQLDGGAFDAVPDSDAGGVDGDPKWDRAAGPLQFIPDTWNRWAADGNGDGVTDPQQVDDAALAASRYLCESGEMRTGQGWRAAVFSYNHLDSYVDQVATTANGYAASAASASAQSAGEE